MSTTPRSKKPALRQRSAGENFSNAAGEFFAAIGKWLVKDPLATFLLLASIALAIIFFSLLGSIQPSSAGQRTDLSNALDAHA